MRKLIVIIILLFCILMCDVSVFANTNESDQAYTMKTYFKNLYDYSPKNEINSCGYVAFVQYLSYFDTFLNDDIIEEKFEKNQGNVPSITDAMSNSPGVLKHNYSIYDVYPFIEEYKDESFLMHLMDYYNRYFNNTPNEYTTDIQMHEYYVLVDYLLSDYNVDFTYTYNNYIDENGEIDYQNENMLNYFNNYIKDKIDNEEPVIVGTVKYLEDYNLYTRFHAVVAYYYDENGIYFNDGNSSDKSFRLLEENEFIYVVGTMELDNIPEKHSNNYIINNEEYCGCGHKHEYTYSCTNISDYEHNGYCDCGRNGESSHQKFLYDDKIICYYCEWEKEIVGNLDDGILNLDLFDYEETGNNTEFLTINSQTSEYIKKIDIKHNINLTINIQTYDTINMFVIKENDVLEIMQEYNISDNSIYTLNLDKGIYYIGYYDSNFNNEVTISITHNVDISLNGLIVDPDSASLCGSQVNLNEMYVQSNQRSYRQTFIVEGFTRIIYLSNGSSRLDYYWYSSDESVVKVSSYGTVLALPVNETKYVTVLAVNKNNPSIVYSIELSVINDELDYLFNTIELNKNMTISSGESMYIDISDLNIPINILQYYSWHSSDYNVVSVSSYGEILVSEFETSETITITGTYKYNNRIVIKIDINII